MIKIVARKVFRDPSEYENYKVYEIVSIEGVKSDEDLPWPYFNEGYPIFFMKKEDDKVFYKLSYNKDEYLVVRVGDILSEVSFNRFIKNVEKAVKRLKEINERLEKEKQEWQGIVEYNFEV